MDPVDPDLRATVRPDGTVRLVPWGPALVSGGPLLAMLRARAPRGLVVADLEILREDPEGPVGEVAVSFLVGDERHALCGWAASVGYRRIWFPDEVVDLEPLPPTVARVRCTGCRSAMEDGSPAFWAHVRLTGAFPSMCVLCGSDLPQWSVRPLWRPGAPEHVRMSDLRDRDRPL